MATFLAFGEEMMHSLRFSVVSLSLSFMMLLLLHPLCWMGFGGFKIIQSCNVRVPANTYWESISKRVSLLKN